MPRCIAENPKLSNIFVSASDKEATSTHSNLFYNLHKSNSSVSQAFFNLRCRHLSISSCPTRTTASCLCPPFSPAALHPGKSERSRQQWCNQPPRLRWCCAHETSQGATLPPKEAAEHSFTHRRTPNFSQRVLCVKVCEVGFVTFVLEVSPKKGNPGNPLSTPRKMAPSSSDQVQVVEPHVNQFSDIKDVLEVP